MFPACRYPFLWLCLLWLWRGLAWAAPANELPADVSAALARSKLPREALSVLVLPVEEEGRGKASGLPRLSHRAEVSVNPASLMKLVTTSAALELLGPSFTWRTPVYVEGVVREGVLQGNLHVRGQGDPRLGVEKLWQLMRRVQGLGIQRIEGDIVLDRSAFEVPWRDPGSFDGEPLRPYNASPDALLINFKSLLIHWVPDRAANEVRIHTEPPLAGVQFPSQLPLTAGECGDYRSAVKADFSDPLKPRLSGAYPASCGEKVWPVAYADPAQFAPRAILGMWQQLGGQLRGVVREGVVPAQLKPVFWHESAPLAEVVRDINKYSNNVMAQQLFLTLSLQQQGLGKQGASQEIVNRWWRERVAMAPPLLDNGSGLSREERITPAALARLLQVMWRSPVMPDLMASLPVAGQDGTLRRSQTQSRAHLKTGSLRDVMGVAGYVDGQDGRRWVLVAILNHPQANAARPVLDALIDWVGR
jgi:D-alanyl-D-alanine carboxypeptidase/D-alanyl-D-alanine-endopeptidase (penicillin-binding protein 4)